MEKNGRRVLRSNWFLFGMACVILVFGTVFTHDFLAVNHPVGKGVLVVEGWIPACALAESANFFNSRHYSHLVVVGGPVEVNGSASRSEEHTSELHSRGHLVCRLLLEQK